MVRCSNSTVNGKLCALGVPLPGEGTSVILLPGARAAHQPIDTRARKWRVDAGSVEFNAVVRAERTKLSSENEHRLLDSLRVKLQRAGVRAWRKTRRDKLIARNLIPSLARHRYLDRRISVKRHGRFTRTRAAVSADAES